MTIFFPGLFPFFGLPPVSHAQANSGLQTDPVDHLYQRCLAEGGRTIGGYCVSITGSTLQGDLFQVPAVRFSGGAVASATVRNTNSLEDRTGWFETTVISEGSPREALVYRPSERPHLPLVIAYHGTNADPSRFVEELGGREQVACAFRDEATLVFPRARDSMEPDWDHPYEGGRYWNTTDDRSESNSDLALTRTLIRAAQRSYRSDPSRVYMIGHSNGGFFALLAAAALPAEVAGFAENAAGWVSQAPKRDFTTRETRCAEILSGGRRVFESWSLRLFWTAWRHDLPSEPQPISQAPSDRRLRGYLRHGAQDDVVSPYYSCALAHRLLGRDSVTEIVPGGGHAVDNSFLVGAWNFLRGLRN